MIMVSMDSDLEMIMVSIGSHSEVIMDSYVGMTIMSIDSGSSVIMVPWIQT